MQSFKEDRLSLLAFFISYFPHHQPVTANGYPSLSLILLKVLLKVKFFFFPSSPIAWLLFPPHPILLGKKFLVAAIVILCYTDELGLVEHLSSDLKNKPFFASFPRFLRQVSYDSYRKRCKQQVSVASVLTARAMCFRECCLGYLTSNLAL